MREDSEGYTNIKLGTQKRAQREADNRDNADMRDNSDKRDYRDNSDTRDINGNINHRNNRASSDNRLHRDSYSDTRDTCGHITNTGHAMAHTRRALSDWFIHNDRRTCANRRCARRIVDIPKAGDNGVYHARVQQLNIPKGPGHVIYTSIQAGVTYGRTACAGEY